MGVSVIVIAGSSRSFGWSAGVWDCRPRRGTRAPRGAGRPQPRPRVGRTGPAPARAGQHLGGQYEDGSAGGVVMVIISSCYRLIGPAGWCDASHLGGASRLEGWRTPTLGARVVSSLREKRA